MKSVAQKIPTLFVRDFDNNPKHVTREVHPECEWVINGEGVATRKYDGTCVRYDGTDWWARREVKPGKQPPPGFQPVHTDTTTGKTIGWEPATQSSFAKQLNQVLDTLIVAYPAGTYELVGPRINGNPENTDTHRLVAHGQAVLPKAPRAYDSLVSYLHDKHTDTGMEGIVWHHPDGRMAKIKAKDFPKPDHFTLNSVPDRDANMLDIAQIRRQLDHGVGIEYIAEAIQKARAENMPIVEFIRTSRASTEQET